MILDQIIVRLFIPKQELLGHQQRIASYHIRNRGAPCIAALELASLARAAATDQATHPSRAPHALAGGTAQHRNLRQRAPNIPDKIGKNFPRFFLEKKKGAELAKKN